LSREGRGPWIELIGQLERPAEVQQLYDSILDRAFTPAATRRAWAALGEAAARNVSNPPRARKNWRPSLTAATRRRAWTRRAWRASWKVAGLCFKFVFAGGQPDT
jgi:plasmid stabilization system protein ParE